MKLTNNMKFAVVIEQGDDSFGAYVPDLPGCVAAGRSRKEVVRLIREAIDEKVERLAPKPRSLGIGASGTSDRSAAAEDAGSSALRR